MTAPEPLATNPAELLPDWEALVEKTLGGASFDKKLVTSTYDGFRINPLYGPHTPGGTPKNEPGLPGQFPCIRGRTASSTSVHGWDIRQIAQAGDIAATNELILEDLRGGVSSIQLDLWDGLTPRLQTFDELDQTLAGVHLDIAAIGLRAGPHFMASASQLITLWDKRGVDRSQARGSLGADPLGTLARGGMVPPSPATMYSAMAKLAQFSATELPQVRSVSIDSSPYHEAGASDAQCLGFALATGVSYLRVLTDAGLSTTEAASEIAFHLPLDANFFSAIATIRALRNLWSRVLNHCDKNTADASAWIHVLPSRRVLTQRAPWVNQLRNTVCCFAGAVAGADAITTLPHDAEYADPSSFSNRVARNTQNVLHAESHLSRVIDAAGGAYFIETLTEELSAKGWDHFSRVESDGGMARALANGTIASRIDTVATERDQHLAKRKQPITGVSEFANLEEGHLQPTGLSEAGPQRDPDPLTLDSESPLDHILNESSAHRVVTITHTMIGPLTLEKGLPLRRDARHFEALRDRSDSHLATHGQRPRVWLACLGTLAEHTTRAAFIRNLLAAGGIDAATSDASLTVEELAGACQRAGADMVVLCGTDSAYTESAQPASQALRAAGATWIGLAGRAREGMGDHIDNFLYLGCNVLEVLETIWTGVEQSA